MEQPLATPLSPPDSRSLSPTAAREDSTPARRPSTGERFFDWLTYGGIAGIGTFLLTIPVAYSIMHGKGAKYYQKAAQAFENKLPGFIAPAQRKRVAEEALMTGALMQGGNAMLIPVAIAEHYKVPIVNGINRAAADPTDPAAIEEVPPQTFGSLIKGRIVAFLAVWGGFTTAGSLFSKTFETFQQECGELACKIARKPVIAESKPYRLGKMAALDTFATATAASLLYVGSHFFARRKAARQHAAPLAAAPTAPETFATPADTAPLPDATETRPGTRIRQAQPQESLAFTDSPPLPSSVLRTG